MRRLPIEVSAHTPRVDVMAITFNCTCGQQLQVDDEHAGAQAQCPECNKVLAVPSPSARPVVLRSNLAKPVRRREPVVSDDDLGAEADSLNPYEAKRRSKRRLEEDDGDPRDEDERLSKKSRRPIDEDEEDYEDRTQEAEEERTA